MVRVLICDDAVAFPTLVRHWLSRCGDIQVVGVARSGAEGLELARRLAPDVVLLDHMLYDVPRGSEELGPLLRECAPGVRIVVVSGMPERDLEAVAARCGADAYVSKGSSPEALCEAVLAAGRALAR